MICRRCCRTKKTPFSSRTRTGLLAKYTDLAEIQGSYKTANADVVLDILQKKTTICICSQGKIDYCFFWRQFLLHSTVAINDSFINLIIRGTQTITKFSNPSLKSFLVT